MHNNRYHHYYQQMAPRGTRSATQLGDAPSSDGILPKTPVPAGSPSKRGGHDDVTSSVARTPRPRASASPDRKQEEEEEGVEDAGRSRSPPRRRYRRDLPALLDQVKKPPNNAFISYYIASYDRLRREHPGLPVTALSAIAAKQYRGLSESDRRKMGVRSMGGAEGTEDEGEEDVCFFSVEAPTTSP